MLEKVETIIKQLEDLLRGARITSLALEKLQQESLIIFNWSFAAYKSIDKNEMTHSEEDVKRATNIAIKLHNKGWFYL